MSEKSNLKKWSLGMNRSISLRDIIHLICLYWVFQEIGVLIKISKLINYIIPRSTIRRWEGLGILPLLSSPNIFSIPWIKVNRHYKVFYLMMVSFWYSRDESNFLASWINEHLWNPESNWKASLEDGTPTRESQHWGRGMGFMRLCQRIPFSRYEFNTRQIS